MKLERKWLRYTLGILILVFLIVFCRQSFEIMAGIKEAAVTAVQQLLNSSLGTLERLAKIGLLLLKFVIVVLWLFCFFITASVMSKFFERKVHSYKQFLLWFLPVKNIGMGVMLYSVYLIYYVIIIMMNSSILLFVAALLVIGIHSVAPAVIYSFQTAMEWLFAFFALDYNPSSFITDFKNLKASEIFGNQSITFFVILFAYLIKVMTGFVYSLLLKIGGHQVVRNLLKINNILSYNYLRIVIYVVAFFAFIIQASYKIMSDVNNIFATFIIVDVIFYTIIGWIKGKTGRANETIVGYFNEIYQYISEVEQRMSDQISLHKKRVEVASVSFIYRDFKYGFVEKLYMYMNKERRQRYFISRKIVVLLKTRYMNTDEILQAAASIKKHILNARWYVPNQDYERMAVRLEEIKLDMANILRAYETSVRAKQMIEKEYLEKQKAFKIQPEKWTSKDQFFRFLGKLRNKERVAQLDQKYEQYLKSIEQVNGKIDDGYVEKISELIKAELNWKLLQ